VVVRVGWLAGQGCQQRGMVAEAAAFGWVKKGGKEE